jgi:hypothetical protein
MMHNVFKMIQHVHQHRFVFGQHVFIEDDANSLRLDLVFLLMPLGYKILPDIRLIDQLVIVQVSSAFVAVRKCHKQMMEDGYSCIDHRNAHK